MLNPKIIANFPVKDGYTKPFALIVAYLISFSTFAQIAVGPTELVGPSQKKFDKKNLEKFKSVKTYFVCRDTDDIEKFNIELKKVWNVSEIEVIPFSEFKTMEHDNAAFFSLGGLDRTLTTFRSNRATNGISASERANSYYYLNLWMMGKSKKGKPERLSFARIELFPAFKDFQGMAVSQNAMDYLYNESTLKNWNLGFLKTYLGAINKDLKKGEERWLYENEYSDKLSLLETKTLYVPDYILTKFNMFNGDESTVRDAGSLFKKYEYKYKVVSTEELSELIINSNEPIYFLSYVKSSTDKYIYIFESQSSNILYSKYKPMSYNLKKSDLKDLSKAIKYAAK